MNRSMSLIGAIVVTWSAAAGAAERTHDIQLEDYFTQSDWQRTR